MVLVSRRVSLVGAESRLLVTLLKIALLGGGGARGSGRSAGLADHHAVTATTAAAVEAGAAAFTASIARATSMAVFQLDEGGHLPLGILQHSTVVVLQGHMRIHRPLGFDMGVGRGRSSSRVLSKHALDGISGLRIASIHSG